MDVATLIPAHRKGVDGFIAETHRSLKDPVFPIFLIPWWQVEVVTPRFITCHNPSNESSFFVPVSELIGQANDHSRCFLTDCD